MKKMFLALVTALMVGTSTTVNAQIWGGQVILRGGFSSNNFKGADYGTNSLPSYNVGVDFNKAIQGDWYWNTGVMFGTRGYKVEQPGDDYTFRAHNINIPITTGYKYKLNNKFAVDGRIGAFLGVDMAGKAKVGAEETRLRDMDDYKRFDGGLVLAFGMWYKNVNLEYMFKRGFAEITSDGYNGAVNHMIRVGYAF